MDCQVGMPRPHRTDTVLPTRTTTSDWGTDSDSRRIGFQADSEHPGTRPGPMQDPEQLLLVPLFVGPACVDGCKIAEVLLDKRTYVLYISSY